LKEKYLLGTYTRRISKGVYQLELDTELKNCKTWNLLAVQLTQHM